jgi:RNA polymerase sigma-70 factor (ECF subfamily)
MKKRDFHELAASQRNRIYSYAYYLLRNQEDAEDVTQEAFVRLWQRCQAPDQKGRIGWLIRVTHNLCMDVKRRRHRAAQYTQTAGEDPQAVPLTRAGTEPDAEHQLLLHESHRALLAALSQLPDVTQSYLLLHYFEGMTYREIGEITDTHPTTVKVQVHRGRQTLKKILITSGGEMLEGEVPNDIQNDDQDNGQSRTAVV